MEIKFKNGKKKIMPDGIFNTVTGNFILIDEGNAYSLKPNEIIKMKTFVFDLSKIEWIK